MSQSAVMAVTTTLLAVGLIFAALNNHLLNVRLTAVEEQLRALVLMLQGP